MADSAGQTVLLVEDEPLNQELAKAIIASSPDVRVRSIRLVPAVTLAQARAVLVTDRIDMVLLDLQLPDGDGLSLAMELRNEAFTDKRPMVVAVTAGALAGDRENAVRHACDDVLLKPYAVDDFQATLTKLFEV